MVPTLGVASVHILMGISVHSVWTLESTGRLCRVRPNRVRWGLKQPCELSKAMNAKAAPIKSDKVVPLFAQPDKPDKKESEKKWGKAVMSHGSCIFPSILLQAQGRLGVNSQEMMVLLQLAEHWWRSDSSVYPSREVIGDRVGLSKKQVQRHVKQLEDLKLVQRSPRFVGGRRTSNYYDLSGLVAKLKSIEPEIAKGKRLKAAATKAGGMTAELAKK